MRTTDFSLAAAVPMLTRTPSLLRSWLWDLPESWTTATEGPDTWSAFDIVGHLIHGERTDWIPRAQLILAEGENRQFEPFDRFAQARESKGKTLNELLEEFAALRAANLATLDGWQLTTDHLAMQGIHPAFGAVTLKQLLATWVAHDLNHLAQIARVMAVQYRDAVGPWREYLGVIKG